MYYSLPVTISPRRHYPYTQILHQQKRQLTTGARNGEKRKYLCQIKCCSNWQIFFLSCVEKTRPKGLLYLTRIVNDLLTLAGYHIRLQLLRERETQKHTRDNMAASSFSSIFSIRNVVYFLKFGFSLKSFWEPSFLEGANQKYAWLFGL